MRLEKVEIEGFRAFNKPLSFNVDGNIVLLVGDNGTGKTSFCDGIQWALLSGKLPQYKGIEEAKEEDMILNRNNNRRIQVSLCFRDGGKRYRIVTSYEKGKKKKPLQPMPKKGEIKIEGDKRLLDFVKRISFEYFTSTIYLTQNSLRKFIEAPIKEKASVLAELLGFQVIEGLQAGIESQLRETKKIHQKIKDELASKTQSKNRYENLLMQRDKLKNEVTEYGVSEENLNYTFAQKLASEIKEDLENIRKIHLESPKKDMESLRNFIENVNSILESLRSELSDLEPKFKRKEELEKAIKEVETELKKSRSLEELEKEINEIEKKKEEINNEIKNKNTYARFMLSAQQVISQQILEGKQYCPLCIRPIDLKELEKRVEETMGEEEKELKQLQKQLEKIEEKEGSLLKLKEDIKEKQEELESLKQEFYRLSKELEGKKTINSQKLRQMEEKCKKLEKLLRFLEHERLLKLQEIPPTIQEEISELEQKEKKYASLLEVLERMKSSLNWRKVITERLDDLKPYIDEFAKILQPHPLFSKICISEEYILYAETEVETEIRKTYVRTIFSTGQLNKVAIILLLAMAKQSSSPFEFIILDDPSQSLDYAGKEQLAKLLLHFSKTKQVIVSTMDKEFAELLQKIEPNAVVYKFKKHTNEGPLVEMVQIK